MCYYHQHACLLVCLPLLSASVIQTSMMIQVTREIKGTLEFKSSGCAVSNNLNYDSSLSMSASVKVIPKLLIQRSVIASNRCVRG